MKKENPLSPKLEAALKELSMLYRQQFLLEESEKQAEEQEQMERLARKLFADKL